MIRTLIFLPAFIVFFSASGLGQTYLSGVLSGNLEAGDYLVNGDLWVNDGETLTIQPGARLTFTGYYGFRIFGTLTAEGTQADSVIFENDPQNPDGWHGLRFEGTGSSASTLAYCRVSGGISQGSGFEDQGGGVYSNDSAPTFRNCLITDNSSVFYGGGVYLNNSSVTFEDCRIEYNSTSYLGGGICSFASDITLDGCEIRSNSAESGGGLNVSEGVVSIRNSIFRGNICTSSGGGLNLSSVPSAVLENLLFENNSANGT